MNLILFDSALVGYLLATVLALVHLVQRQEAIYRLAVLVTLAGWVLHTLALVVRGVELGRPPLGTLVEAMSVVGWAAVLLTLWAERQYRVKVLGAFVLPLVALSGVSGAWLPPGFRDLAPALRNAGISVHVILAMLGIPPFALFSFLAWLVDAATLGGRAVAGWRGRRAAYFAVVGFGVLLLTLGAGLLLPGRHGS